MALLQEIYQNSLILIATFFFYMRVLSGFQTDVSTLSSVVINIFLNTALSIFRMATQNKHHKQNT